MIEKLKKALDKHGIGGVLKLTADSVLLAFGKYVFSREIFLIAERELTGNIEEVETKYPVDRVEIKSENIHWIKKRIDNRKLKIFEARMNDKFTGFYAVDGNKEIASYAWIAYGSYDNPLMGLTIHLKDGEAYLFDDYTFDEFRGKKIHKYLLAERLRFLADRGYQKCLVSFKSSNIVSRKNYEKNLFDEVKEVNVYNLFGKKFQRIRKLKNAS